MFRQHRPDVALLDLRMPGMSGVEAAAAIRAEFPDARMIALTTYGGDEDIRRALAAGVQAYLTKDVLHDELLKAIRAVHAGQTYLPAARGGGAGGADAAAGSERARSAGAGADRARAGEQADRVRAEHRGAHGEESREEYPEQAGRAGPDAGGHRGHPARHHSSLTPLAGCEAIADDLESFCGVKGL